MACLGAPDKKDDNFLVVVGAPYYKYEDSLYNIFSNFLTMLFRQVGAIFVYRSQKGSSQLSWSQTILSPLAAPRGGFGMKLSNPDPGTRPGAWRAEGIAVSAPESGEAWYYR